MVIVPADSKPNWPGSNLFRFTPKNLKLKPVSSQDSHPHNHWTDLGWKSPMRINRHEPCYFGCNKLEEGRSVSVQIKGWRYFVSDSSEFVLLELRGPAECCSKLPQSRYLHQLVREGILPDGEWRNCWETVGLDVNDCLVKSERASQSDNKHLTGLQMPGLCRTEWQIIPDALLVLLVQWSLAAGKRKQQSASKVFLCSFISAVASGSWLKQLLARVPAAQAWGLCPQGSESKQCPHLEQGFRAHLQGDDKSLQTGFVECLLSLWAWVDECPSCKAIFQQLISEVTEQSTVSCKHGCSPGCSCSEALRSMCSKAPTCRRGCCAAEQATGRGKQCLQSSHEYMPGLGKPWGGICLDESRCLLVLGCIVACFRASETRWCCGWHVLGREAPWKSSGGPAGWRGADWLGRSMDSPTGKRYERWSAWV